MILLVNSVWIVWMTWYVVSFGIFMWKEEQSKVGAVGAFVAAFLGFFFTTAYYLTRG